MRPGGRHKGSDGRKRKEDYHGTLNKKGLTDIQIKAIAKYGCARKGCTVI